MTDHRNILVIEQFDTDNLLEPSLNQLGYAAVTLFLSNVQSLKLLINYNPMPWS